MSNPMSRGVDAAMTAALASGGYHAAVLVFVDWPGDPVRVHSGIGTLTWDGHDWTGIGVHGMGGRLTLPGERSGIASTEGQAVLGGLPDDIDAILATDAREAAVQAWAGITTQRAGNVLVCPPVHVWAGYIDGLSDSEDETDARGNVVRRIIAPLVSRQSQRLSPSAYHTDEDQQAEYPGDTAGRWLRAARQRMQAEVIKF